MQYKQTSEILVWSKLWPERSLRVVLARYVESGNIEVNIHRGGQIYILRCRKKHEIVSWMAESVFTRFTELRIVWAWVYATI